MFPLNIPNLLTLLRILLVPVIVVALLEQTPDADMLAAAVFAAAALTDGLDGHIARSRGSITTFGKLMDPIADKLLIVASLISLVSLGRVEAWVAMVIIGREFAVTALRMIAVEQGVVIPATVLGKAKTVTQVIAIFGLIAFTPTPTWVNVVVYVAVAITLISGADYFLGLRKRIEQARRERAAERSSVTQARGAETVAGSSGLESVALEPLAHRQVMRRGLARAQLAAQVADQPVALGDDVVLVDRLEVLLARHHEGVVVDIVVGGGDAAHHLAHAVLDEARPAMGLLDHGLLVGALHQLEDLRAHRLLDDP